MLIYKKKRFESFAMTEKQTAVQNQEIEDNEPIVIHRLSKEQRAEFLSKKRKHEEISPSHSSSSSSMSEHDIAVLEASRKVDEEQKAVFAQEISNKRQKLLEDSGPKRSFLQMFEEETAFGEALENPRGEIAINSIKNHLVEKHGLSESQASKIAKAMNTGKYSETKMVPYDLAEEFHREYKVPKELITFNNVGLISNASSSSSSSVVDNYITPALVGTASLGIKTGVGAVRHGVPLAYRAGRYTATKIVPTAWRTAYSAMESFSNIFTNVFGDVKIKNPTLM